MAQFKKPSKKTTIITLVIIAVLLIIAATGTVMFLKDRGQTEASEIGLESREQNSEIQNGIERHAPGRFCEMTRGDSFRPSGPGESLFV